MLRHCDVVFGGGGGGGGRGGGEKWRWRQLNLLQLFSSSSCFPDVPAASLSLAACLVPGVALIFKDRNLLSSAGKAAPEDTSRGALCLWEEVKQCEIQAVRVGCVSSTHAPSHLIWLCLQRAAAQDTLIKHRRVPRGRAWLLSVPDL